MTFICCLHSFLTDRQAGVQLHNVCSSSRRFNQGLTWGSVLAPQLFLSYINNLAKNSSNDAVIALFKDDVFILITASKKEDAVAAAQSEVTKVYEWSRTWKHNLNVDKSKCCPFSTWSNDSKWCPRLLLEDNRSESVRPHGYLALSLTAAFHSMLMLDTSNSHSHQDFELLQLQHMLPGVGRNLYYELLPMAWSAPS